MHHIRATVSSFPDSVRCRISGAFRSKNRPRPAPGSGRPGQALPSAGRPRVEGGRQQFAGEYGFGAGRHSEAPEARDPGAVERGMVWDGWAGLMGGMEKRQWSG